MKLGPTLQNLIASAIPQNPKQEPSDGDHSSVDKKGVAYPIWSRLADERDQIRFLRRITLGSVALNIILAIALALTTGRPVMEVAELTGYDGQRYVVYPERVAYKAREDTVQAFVRETFGALYDVSPGHYDIAAVVPRLTPAVVDDFEKKIAPLARDTSHQPRILWRMRALRYYPDPLSKKLLTVAARCELTKHFIEGAPSGQPGGTGETQTGTPRIEHTDYVVVIWLARTRATPSNPYGLILVGWQPFYGREAEEAWGRTIPLSEGAWPDGTRLATPPKTEQERWKEKYNQR